MLSNRLVLVSTLLALFCIGPLAAEPPGQAPAATLLLPYFEVDLVDPDGITTLLSVNNAASQPTIAHVVLWTDWGVPTYSFDLVLAADDVQTINLRDIFVGGTVPATDGTGVSGCEATVPAPNLNLDQLGRQHTGRPQADLCELSCFCSGSGRLGPDVAIGYATVDVANRCGGDNLTFPNDFGYFDSSLVDPPNEPFADTANVLWGDIIYVANDDNSAQGAQLVALPYDAEAEISGDTFYRRYSNGQDGRTGLGSRYRGRFFNGGAFDGGTDLLVWLEPAGPADPIACGTRSANVDVCQSADFRLFDEAGIEHGNTTRAATEVALRLEVGGGNLPTDTDFGFFDLNHFSLDACVILPTGVSPRQAWATSVVQASGRFSAAIPATRLP